MAGVDADEVELGPTKVVRGGGRVADRIVPGVESALRTTGCRSRSGWLSWSQSVMAWYASIMFRLKVSKNRLSRSCWNGGT